MLPLSEPGNKVWPTYLPSYPPSPLPSRCFEIHLTLWPLSLLRYREEVNHIVIAPVPSVTLPEGSWWPQRGSQRRPWSCDPPPSLRPCRAACLWLNLLPPPQASQHITLVFYYSPASQHTQSHVKAGHKPPWLAVPFLPLRSAFSPLNAIHLHPAAQCLSRTFSVSFSLLVLTPSMTRIPPPKPSQPHSPPIMAPLIPRARVRGGRAQDWRLMAGNGEGRMNSSQMGINKETGLKDGSCYGQRGGGGWGWRNATAATSGWSHAWYTPQHVTSVGAVSSMTRGRNIHSDDGSQAWG